MLLIIVEGIVLALIAKAWIVLYLIWSWRVLRDSSNNRASRLDTWLRLAFAAVITGFIGPLLPLAIGSFSILLTQNLQGQELAVVEFFIGLAFWPYGGMQMPAVTVQLLWLVTAILSSCLLVSGSIIQWLFLRKSAIGARSVP